VRARVRACEYTRVLEVTLCCQLHDIMARVWWTFRCMLQ